MLIHTQRLRLLTCELPHLTAIAQNPASLGTLLGVTVPDHWPAHRSAYGHAEALARKNPLLVMSGWWLYLFVDPASKVLVGSGGFKSAPDADGIIEIGCEIAPDYRRQAYATEALLGLIRYAFSRSGVSAVQGHSLARKCPRSELLRALGMKKVGVAADAAAGEVWVWQLSQEAYLQLASRAGD